jgi:hypothetical protein
MQGDVMSVEFLRQIAATPLPKSFHGAQEIDVIKILRETGLVLTLMAEPPEGASRVLAITEKGRKELLRFHYPDNSPTRDRGKGRPRSAHVKHSSEAWAPNDAAAPKAIDD